MGICSAICCGLLFLAVLILWMRDDGLKDQLDLLRHDTNSDRNLGIFTRDNLLDLDVKHHDLRREHDQCVKNATVEVLQGKLVRSTQNSACWDLYANTYVQVNPGEQMSVPTGVVTKMNGCDAIILSKSGLSKKFRISHRAGVIDEDYPKEWEVLVANEGKEPFIVFPDTKIAQVFFVNKQFVQVTGDDVEELDDERTGGFGSTGL